MGQKQRSSGSRKKSTPKLKIPLQTEGLFTAGEVTEMVGRIVAGVELPTDVWLTEALTRFTR